MLRGYRKPFEHEEEEENCYNQMTVNNFTTTIILNIKVTVIEKHYQLKNILIKLDYT